MESQLFDERQPTYQLLKRAIAERVAPLVFVVGSGLSKPAGLPDWGTLRKDIEQQLRNDDASKRGLLPDHKSEVYEDALTTPDNWQFFEASKRILTPGVFSAIIENELRPRSETLPAGYSSLMKLQPKGIITLNLDRFAGDAAASRADGRNIIPIYGKEIERKWRILKEEKPFVVYLHGHISDRSTWILTQSDIEELLSKEAHKLLLTTLYLDYTVVFVGVSADDISLSQRLIELSEAGFTPSRLFWITSRVDAETSEWAKNNEVSLIRYAAANTEEHTVVLKLICDDIAGFKSLDNPQPAPGEAPEFQVETEKVAPVDLASRPPEFVRKVLSTSLARRLAAVAPEETYAEFEKFCVEYEYPIASRSFYRSGQEGFDVFFDHKLTFPKLGGGNFGEVYAAIDQNAVPVAIKIMRQNILGNREMLGGFRRGVKSMAILTAANVAGVARLRESFEMPPTIVMEIIAGNSIEELFSELQKTHWSAKIAIVFEICNIVGYCHKLKEGILHRDIKPSNVMLEGFDYADHSFSRVVMLDFDMSWHKGSREADVVFESRDDFGYLAPEQTNPALAYAARSSKVDSYGLGMTMYAMFTGSRPIANAALDETWERRVRSGVGRGIADKFLSVPNRISRIIVDATKVHQEDRIDFSSLVTRVEKIKAIADGKVDSGYSDVMAEEILARISMSPNDYIWDDVDESGGVRTMSGLDISFKSLAPDRGIRVRITFEDTGVMEHRRRDRAIGAANDRALRFGRLDYVKPRMSTINTGRYLYEADFRVEALHLNECVAELRGIMDCFTKNT